MGKKKYVAYVGTYTHGTSKGIQVYDVDVEKGTLTERSEVEVSNASHLAVSKNGKYLYSIEDEGVAVFERDKNGDPPQQCGYQRNARLLSCNRCGRKISLCGRVP